MAERDDGAGMAGELRNKTYLDAFAPAWSR